MSTLPTSSRTFHRSRAVAWLLLLFSVILIAFYPAAQDYLRAASLLQRIANPEATGRIANYHVHPVDVRDTTFHFRGRQIPARIYLPRAVGFAPGIVVLHGMHELGIEEPRLVSFARSLAASGFFVMTPLLPGIAEYHVEGESAELIGTAAQSFRQELDLPKVGVLAFSFSGGLALLAASDPQYAPSIGWVATVGAHYDLGHVLRFFATGEAVRPDGAVEHLSPHEYGSLIVVNDEPQDFFAPQDVDAARRAIKLLLSGHGKESESLTHTMTPTGQRVMQQIYHKEREAFTLAILAEVDKRREQLAAASPVGHLRSLQMPILLLHGSGDTVIPPTELLWLEREVPQDELRSALISPAISHVEVGSKVRLWDRLALVHWMVLLIREARAAGENQHPAEAPAGDWLAPAMAEIH
jgi:dienelactone hydrolase